MLHLTVSTDLTGLRLAAIGAAAWVACLAASEAAGTNDPELIALVQAEYTSVDDFSGRLALLESVLADKGDARAPFAAMYVVLTRNADDLIRNGGFDDGEWVAAFMVAFGNLYRQAFFDYESGNLDAVPESWRIAFDAAAENEITVFQHALLGVHTHINRDMPFAIAQVTPSSDRARRFRDFVRTNDFIVASIGAVEDAVSGYDLDLLVLDDRMGRTDERLLKNLLSAWRFRAWHNAATLSGPVDAFSYRFAGAYLDRVAGRRALFFRDSDAVFALGSGGAGEVRLLPQRAKRFAGGHADAVLVEIGHGRVLEVDLD